MKIAYWIFTAGICGLMLFSAIMYLTQYEMVSGLFTGLGFPAWLVYPLAIVKILAVTAILTKLSPFLKEWAYAGIFFDVVMATSAHLMANDGQSAMAIMGIILIVGSYILDGKVFGNAAFPKVDGR